MAEYHSLNLIKEITEDIDKLTYITDDNPSFINVQKTNIIYCHDIGDGEYAIGTSRLRLVVKKEDVSEEFTDVIMSLYDHGWLSFYTIDPEINKVTPLHDRFALALLTTPRRSNIVFIIHNGYNRIGKVESKFVLDIVRTGMYNNIVSKTIVNYWYTLRVPVATHKNEIQTLNNMLQALKYMYINKRVIYDNIEGIYNGILDPYSFNIGFDQPRSLLTMVLMHAKDHEHFGELYDQVKKSAEEAGSDNMELLFNIATIYDIYQFIKRVYKEYMESYSIIMKEYFEAIFKNRLPEKSPIEVTIIDFESKYKKKIED